MARERIVLETSDQRKAALVRSVDLQGGTLADWLEEQITVTLPDGGRTLQEDIKSPADPLELADAEAVFGDIVKQDWAFTDDDTRYLTHDLHPYPAKFIPQIPAHLIARLSVPGDVVLDPFGGSATTAVEAVRMRRRAISIDANPLSALIGRVKTSFMSDDVRTQLTALQAATESYVAGVGERGNNWDGGMIARHASFIPDIPNREKWFSDTATAELALLRYLIEETTEGTAQDAALVALSRIVIRASNQESETRYVSEPKPVVPGLCLRAYLEALRTVSRRLEAAATALSQADARFLVGDSRTSLVTELGENVVDLIVTSPPYPNATDYHLYHRFRLFWLGFDPKALGVIEIGSHLRHQRNGTGFEEYRSDMLAALRGCYRALQPGRYAVLVVGDALFKGEIFSTSDALAEAGKEVGFELVGIHARPIHQTRRSFASAARRARSEQLLVLRKPAATASVLLVPPKYKLWPYEERLRKLEVEALTNAHLGDCDGGDTLSLKLDPSRLWNLRRLTFTAEYKIGGVDATAQPTWQRTLENGDAEAPKRKDPKYATHGIHPYKGKFYPQLAKALLNISGAPVGGAVLDPFCGSGTILLEGMLNGFQTYGCDFNPLAAKITRAKTSIFTVDRMVVEHATQTLLSRLDRPVRSYSSALDQFSGDLEEELERWFPVPVLQKLNWLLAQVRLFGEPNLVEYFEVIVSSIVRDVSQQDPTDLRIRRRKEPLEDAPVLALFRARLEQQHQRMLKHWSVAGRQPGPILPPKVAHGDCRKLEDLCALGLKTASLDCVVTSPPYATALPYIDTDRLSLMAIMGLPSQVRSDLEENLTGSREIRRKAKQNLEELLLARDAHTHLPKSVVAALRAIHKANSKGDVGFRRDNMPALLWRYFVDMKANLENVATLLKPGGRAYYVVGDSRTNAGGNWVTIETCRHVTEVAEMVGLKSSVPIDIDVTTENYKHIKNAITENKVLIFEKKA